ncbi:MAG TPA: hypothetical protein VG870_13925 [Chitinophagaceae bacterium]|nr:hypothetical protein [Chitinophagaceae bacterium]
MPTFRFLCLSLVSVLIVSCGTQTRDSSPQPASRPNPMLGTWRLLTGTLVEKGQTTVTDYTRGVSFIKIINGDHFAFLQHDLTKGKDSAVFVAGGGRYDLRDSTYTEHLEYCSAREWEGNDFTFRVSLRGDTLVQQGVEKVAGAGVDRVNTERYVRVKD